MRRLSTVRGQLEAKRDISQQGIFRGKLAEPYDGIGQYVMVALAGSAVGAAYKARVASGDFNGGRTFPTGTPVTVLSYHGTMEVLLGNQPGCRCGDAFSRSEDSGWGTGPLGLWTPVADNPQDFSVDGGAGLFDLGGFDNAYIGAQLAGSISLPFEAMFEVSVIGDNPFTKWSGAGAGTSDFEFIVNIGEGEFSFPGIGILNSFLIGNPLTGIGLAAGDDRGSNPGGFGVDQDDVIPFTWPEFEQTVGPIMYRLYIDEYGTYFRCWLKNDEEPLVMDRTTNPSAPYDVLGNVLHPFWSSPADEASFLGGKGEPWSAYDCNHTGKIAADAPGARIYDTMINGGSARAAMGYLHDICIISGGTC